MDKMNCWEYMKCGREAGGKNSSESGVCPVAEDVSANSLNMGLNGGRICWVIVDDLSEKNIKCSGTHDKDSCLFCEFRFKVMQEEGLLNICNATGKLIHQRVKSNKSLIQ